MPCTRARQRRGHFERINFFWTFAAFAIMSKTILIIEDDKDILDIMEIILTDEGLTVVSAPSAVALAELSEIRPALILLDNRLANGYGGDFCRAIKENPETSHFPVILISAHVDLKILSLNSLADGYIAKPFDLNELLQTVRRYCKAIS